MMKVLYSFIFSFIYIVCKGQFALDAETGVCQFGYNDVRISGKEGTFFSLSNDFESKVNPYYRIRASYTIKKRHTLSVLYAPLTIKSSGVPVADIYFQDEIFNRGVKTDYTWKFNSYRLSYQYNLVSRDHYTLGLGLTGKVRDAKIALANSNTYAEKTNIGVVPLIRFYSNWEFVNKWNFIVDGDALVGKQGRAEDILIAVGYSPLTHLNIKLGYRLLEGGADNEEVYNFSAVHYASLSATWTFIKK
jgi:hypothetical protein